jgi:hypothetical protein
MKRITDSLMAIIFKYASEKRDFSNSDDFRIVSSVLKSTENVEDGSLLIDKETLIISCPYQIDNVNKIHKDIEKIGFIPEIIKASERFLYVQELNLLVMNEGASHRLAAIYLHVNNDKVNNSILLDNKYLNFQTINVEKLSKFNIDKKAKIVAYAENGIKHFYFLKTQEVLDLIEFLQKKYLGESIKFSFMKKIKFRYIYKYSHGTRLQNSFIENKLYFDNEIPILNKLYRYFVR